MWRLAIIIFLLANGFCYQNVLAEPTKIVLATDDWEPYVSKTLAGHGQFSEIVTAIFKEMGMDVQYRFAPWRRVEALVQSGDVFAGIPYSCTPERRAFYECSEPIMNSSYVFFYNKKAYPNGINYTTLADLTRYRIGGVTGYWYESIFANAHLKVEYVIGDDLGIKKLYANRIDLAATDALVGWTLIKKLYPQEFNQFAIAGAPFATQKLHLLVSKKYPNGLELMQKFNATLKQMRVKGTAPPLNF